MKICFFGDFDPAYNRTRTILIGLEKLGVEVIHCNILETKEKHYFKLMWKLFRLRGQYDVIVVGMSNSRMMPILAKIAGNKPVVWDALYSLYDNWVFDRKYVKPHSIKAYRLWLMDWLGATLSDVIYLDTKTHEHFFSETFHIPLRKFAHVLVGADTNVFTPLKKTKTGEKFEVEFHGKYIPLQGVETIVRTAKLLEDKGVHFTMIGSGQDEPKAKKLAEELQVTNITFLPFLPQSEITEYIRNADVCLGLLGDVPRVVRSIPNKMYEVAAMARVCVNVDSTSLREYFVPGVDAIGVRQGDAEDIAGKILELKESGRAEEMGEAAYQTFLKIGTPEKVAESLVALIRARCRVTF
jgi:glycosyltransferase involved in cell wall biosynthesis